MTKQMQPTRKLAANLWVKKNKISFLKKEFRLKNYKNIIALILVVFYFQQARQMQKVNGGRKGLIFLKHRTKYQKNPVSVKLVRHLR